ncbi:MAG: hypothetical protein U5K29_15580 [Acidimicrobiales bacterium]|nr:hypothetical protein [Acidimicrobiales bacterium]
MDQRAISGMTTGAFLATVGAILYFAVTATVSGFDLKAAGAILMIVGLTVALGALLWALTMGNGSNRTHVVERTRVEQPTQPRTTEAPQRVVSESRNSADYPPRRPPPDAAPR